MIYWEVLQWVVDWFNNTFTSQHTITTVQDLFLGWLSVSPSLYTKSWRRIVFNTAPILWAGSPILDYFEWEDYPVSATADTLTVLEIVNDTYTLLWRWSTSTIFPKAIMLKYINECFLKNKNKIKDNSLYSSYSFSKSANIYTDNFYRWDLIKIRWTIDNYFPRTWKILLNETIVDFTTRTGTAFTLSDWQTFTQSANMKLIAWYKLPADVLNIVKLTVDWYEINSIRPEEINKYSWNDLGFLVKDWYVFILWDYSIVSTNYVPIVKINYKKVNSLFLLDGDIIPIPYEYTSVLSDYSAYKMLQDREDDRWQGLANRYREWVREWNAYTNRHSKPEHRITFSWPLSNI